MGKQGSVSRTEAESVSMKVVNEVAEREDVDPTELAPPLHAAVDPDSLDATFSNGDGNAVEVRFSYKGYEVNVAGGDQPRVRVEQHSS